MTTNNVSQDAIPATKVFVSQYTKFCNSVKPDFSTVEYSREVNVLISTLTQHYRPHTGTMFASALFTPLVLITGKPLFIIQKVLYYYFLIGFMVVQLNILMITVQAKHFFVTCHAKKSHVVFSHLSHNNLINCTVYCSLNDLVNLTCPNCFKILQCEKLPPFLELASRKLSLAAMCNELPNFSRFS